MHVSKAEDRREAIVAERPRSADRAADERDRVADERDRAADHREITEQMRASAWHAPDE